MDGPNGGVTDSLDKAKSAFRGAAALTDGAPGRGRSASVFVRKKRTRYAQPEPICS
jgi:hypothetical protein